MRIYGQVPHPPTAHAHMTDQHLMKTAATKQSNSFISSVKTQRDEPRTQGLVSQQTAKTRAVGTGRGKEKEAITTWSFKMEDYKERRRTLV